MVGVAGFYGALLYSAIRPVQAHGEFAHGDVHV